MQKPKLVLRHNEFTSFHSPYLQFFWTRYFEVCYFESNQSYDSTTLFVVNHDQINDELSKQLRDNGHRVVVDNLWQFSAKIYHGYHLIKNTNWHWYNQSIWWSKLGYHRYRPNKKYCKLALMQAGQHGKKRNDIIDVMGNRLDNFLWSYGDRALPGDQESSESDYQVFFNPQWYDDTYFSVVVDAPNTGAFSKFTNRIFKPAAYHHPFLLLGEFNALKNFRELGFETYENIFDESYDTMLNFYDRLDAVVTNIDNFTAQKYDATTLNKLQHNHDHFFDQQLVQSRMLSEIVEPLLHYAETR